MNNLFQSLSHPPSDKYVGIIKDRNGIPVMKYTKLFVMERRVKYDIRYFVLYIMNVLMMKAVQKVRDNRKPHLLSYLASVSMYI